MSDYSTKMFIVKGKCNICKKKHSVVIHTHSAVIPSTIRHLGENVKGALIINEPNLEDCINQELVCCGDRKQNPIKVNFSQQIH